LLDGRREERWAGDAFIGPDLTKPSLELDGDGMVFSTHQAHAQPPELASFDRTTNQWHRLTGFNDAVIEGRTFPDVRVVRWAAPDDGLEIQGRLYTPPGATGPLPLIVAVHGGPTWNWNAYFSDSEPNAVLCSRTPATPSSSRTRAAVPADGTRSPSSSSATPGGIDLRDILAGVDWCVAGGMMAREP
jgi:hypothetical protein